MGKTGVARRANNFTFSEVIGAHPKSTFCPIKTSFFTSLPPSSTHFSGSTSNFERSKLEVERWTFGRFMGSLHLQQLDAPWPLNRVTASPALRAPSPPVGERNGVRGCGSRVGDTSQILM